MEEVIAPRPTAESGGRGVTGRTTIPADDAGHGLEVGSGGGAGGEPGAAAPARAGAELFGYELGWNGKRSYK